MVRNLSISLLVVMTCRRAGHLGQMPLSIVISMALGSEAYSSSSGSLEVHRGMLVKARSKTPLLSCVGLFGELRSSRLWVSAHVNMSSPQFARSCGRH